MKAVLLEPRQGRLLALLAGILAAAGLCGASPIACAPLVLPDGHTIPGPCPDDSWFPRPPWWYLPPTPPEPGPPPLPPYAYIPDPGYPLPPSEFFLFAYEPDWTPPGPGADPPAYLLGPEPPDFPDPAPEHAPEPAGLALIGLGLLALGILGRWRRGKLLN